MSGKKVIITSLITSMILVGSIVGYNLFLKPCEHQWQDANCETPVTCKICTETAGNPLGHNWNDANCTEVKTCSACGTTEGESLGHKWNDANCTDAKTCSVCGTTEGEALGHNWKNATYSTPKTCLVCGKTEGGVLTNSKNNSNNNSNNNETLTKKDLVGTWNCTNKSGLVTILYDNNTATIIQQLDKKNTSAGSDDNGDFVYTQTEYKQKETRNYTYTLEGKYINLKLTSSTIQTIGGTETITKTITETGEKSTETKEIKEGEIINNFENTPKEIIFSYDIVNDSLYLDGNLKFTKKN